MYTAGISRMWYRRTFTLPASWASLGAQRTLLNFGAVDWESEVWVNGVRLGLHRGGCAHALLTAPQASCSLHDAMSQLQHPMQRSGSCARTLHLWSPQGRGASSLWAADMLQHIPAMVPMLR